MAMDNGPQASNTSVGSQPDVMGGAKIGDGTMLPLPLPLPAPGGDVDVAVNVGSNSPAFLCDPRSPQKYRL